MKRYLLTLLAAASTAQAASLDEVACWTGAINRSNAPAIEQARRTLADAEAQPGREQLVLADALANLANALNGSDDQAAAAQAMQRAQAIWSAAQPEPQLAVRLQARGREYFAAHQCQLAWPVLQTAFTLTEKLNGPEDPQTLLAMHDLLSVAVARGDVATVNTLAPRLLKAWEEHGVPAGDDSTRLYRNLSKFYYMKEDYARAEPLARYNLRTAKAAGAPHSPLVRLLTLELASIYYAQLRHTEADDLLAPFVPEPKPSAEKRKREEMAGLVRAGDLKGALASGQAALAEYEAKLAREKTALAAAEADAKADKPSAQAKTALARARNRQRAASRDVALMHGYIGEIHHALNNLGQAEAMYVLALDEYAALADNSSVWMDAIRTRSDLAILYRMRGEPERALPLQKEALAEMRPLFGPDHPDVRESESELALINKAIKH